MFFKDDKHIFIVILVAILVATPADRQMFWTNENDTIISYETYVQI